MGYLDRGVTCTEAAIQKVVEIFRLHRPDLVVSFEFYRRATPYPHPDHLAAGEIVRRAVARYEGRDRLDYLVTSTILPNVFLDVTGVRRVKLEALACHTTQTGLNGIIFPFLEKLITRIWGAFAGVDYAEGYRLIDIPKLVARLGPNDESA
jgi:LmbE family N-acetylglucosaminyl deacetylase